MKKIIQIFLVFYLFTMITAAQAQQQKWVARYNGPGNGVDAAKVVLVDGSGNVYVAGQSTGSGSNLDYALIKYNSSGVQQWVQRFNGIANGRDYITAMVFDGSGNIIVTGASQGPGHTGRNMDVVTIKYNTAGVQQWIHTFNGFNGWDDIPHTMVLDASGNLIIGGSTVETYDDLMTLKYSSSGALLWARAHDGDFLGFDHGSGATVDASGNVYTAGFVETASEAWDIVTVKYNAAGVQQWVRGYTGSAHLDDCATGIIADGSGNIITGGYAHEAGIGVDYLTIKYNSTGDVVWTQHYNNQGVDIPTSMKFDQSGNLIITGSSHSGFNPQVSDYSTVKYNSSGVQQWSAIYGTPAVNDVPWSITSDAAGNVYVTGESGTFSLRDYATIKYSAAGVQQWVQKYNGPGNATDIANSVAVDNLGNIYVTGESAGRGTGQDFATIKYSQMLFGAAEPASSNVFENYPNPFNPETVISYELQVTSSASLKIYDILGNEVATLVNEIQNAGYHFAKWDATNFASGIYFYRLVTNGFVKTKKMNLVK